MQASLVLYTLAYDACVAFYREVLGLPVLFSTPDLVCFRWGQASLMVEREDEPATRGARAGHPSCIRFLVDDVLAHTAQLRRQGIEVDYQEHDWGTVAKFEDPDGNLCAFKDLAGFERQVSDAGLIR